MHVSVSLSEIQIEVPKRSLYNMNVHVLLHQADKYVFYLFLAIAFFLSNWIALKFLQIEEK